MFIRCCFFISITYFLNYAECRDEEKILKACYWPNELYEPCFGGCAEVSCDNPRNHLRPCYPYCEPGCVCEEPYVRDDRTHQCVLPQDCSPTQMGIPVPAKAERRSDKLPPLAPPKQAFRAAPRTRRKGDGLDDFGEDIAPAAPAMQGGSSASSKDENYKRMSEVSRMGNYFNIVIAPPPIKALQPRKMMNNGYVSTLKRLS